MAIDTEVLGEQLAADVSAQARAREELARTRLRIPAQKPTPVVVLLLVIIPLVVFFMPWDAGDLRRVATGLAVLAVGAVFEFNRLSRRLEAALALLKPYLDAEVRK